MPRPLFVTCTARSGSNLISMMLSAHSEITITPDPFLEFYRSFRNAVVATYVPSHLQNAMPPHAPLADYYFRLDLIEILRTIQSANLDIPFPADQRERFQAIVAERAALAAAEILPWVQQLEGSTYKDLYDSAQHILEQSRHASDKHWIGAKEVWTVEFLPAIARAYADAKFIVLLRDPRAILASMLGFQVSDETQVAHSLSYNRHWRKTVACLLQYQQDPLFQDRIFALKYEDFLLYPETTARRLSEFLDVTYEPDMVDPSKYFDYSKQTMWTGNSTFEASTAKLFTHRTDHWRSKLDPLAAKMTDFVCGMDMIAMGYEPQSSPVTDDLTADALRYLYKNNIGQFSWRTDSKDPLKEFGYELARHAILERIPQDISVIERCFLFGSAYEQLRDTQKRYKEGKIFP